MLYKERATQRLVVATVTDLHCHTFQVWPTTSTDGILLLPYKAKTRLPIHHGRQALMPCLWKSKMAVVIYTSNPANQSMVRMLRISNQCAHYAGPTRSNVKDDQYASFQSRAIHPNCLSAWCCASLRLQSRRWLAVILTGCKPARQDPARIWLKISLLKASSCSRQPCWLTKRSSAFVPLAASAAMACCTA